MDRETFLDTIRQQYAEDIQEAFIECEHSDGRGIDYKRLNGLLIQLMKNAKFDGLPPKDFEDLVKSTLPEVADKVELIPAKKAA